MRKLSVLLTGIILASALLTMPGCSVLERDAYVFGRLAESALTKTSSESSSSAVSASATSSAAAVQSSSMNTSSAVSKSQTPKNTLIKSKDGSISFSIPAGWKDITAQLKLMEISVTSATEAQYVEVIRQPKSDFASTFTVNDYMTLIKEGVSKDVTGTVWGKTSHVKVNGMNAVTVEVSGTYEKVNSVFWFYCISGKKYFYKVTGGTIKSEKSSSEQTIKNIINTFQEVA